MAGTDVSSTSSSLYQDNVIPQEYEAHHGNTNPGTDCKLAQSSSHSSNPSLIKRFISSFFTPRGGGKLTSVASASPSETTPLLVPLTSRTEDHESHETFSIFWNEVKTLVKYALPVFGFVYDLFVVHFR